MALNGSRKDITALRRELVARFRLQQYTIREIAEKLAEMEFVNPSTGEPFGYVTVQRDLVALQEEWRQNAAQTIDEHLAIQLAEIKHAKRMAIDEGSTRNFLQALQLEMKLLGTPRPEKIDVTSNEQTIMSSEVAMARIAEIMAKAMERE